MEISDKTQKMSGKFEMKTSSPISEEKKNPENIDVSDKDGNIQAQFVKANGKVIQQAASVDAQSTGMNEKAGKKAGLKADGVVPTAASVSVAKAAVDAKDGDKQKHAEKAKLLLSQAKSKSAGGKPKEGKADSSMSKMASEKTGMTGKDGSRDIGADMAKEKKMEKSGDSEDQIRQELYDHQMSGKGRSGLSRRLNSEKVKTLVEKLKNHPKVSHGYENKIQGSLSERHTYRKARELGQTHEQAMQAVGRHKKIFGEQGDPNQLEKAKPGFVPFKDYTSEQHLKTANNLYGAWEAAKKAGNHEQAEKFAKWHEQHMNLAGEKQEAEKQKQGEGQPASPISAVMKKAQTCFSKKTEGMEKSKHSNGDSVTKELRHVMKKISNKK